MMVHRFGSALAALGMAWLVASGAWAQDPETGDIMADDDFGGSASARVSTSSSRRRGGGSSFYLEMQGRIDAFAVAGVDAVVSDSGTGGLGVSLPMVPFMALGVRLLDQKLYVGLGLGFGSRSISTDREAPVPDTDERRSAFMLTPMATFDVLVRGAVALYPLVILKMGSIGGGDNDNTPDPEGAFWWGLNAGVGLRGDVTDNVGLFTEFGWGFAHGAWSTDTQDESRFFQGLFAAMGLAIRMGL